MGGSVSRYVRVSLLRPTLLLLFFSFPGIIFAQPAPLTLPANMKGVQYFPRGHAWWNMLYDRWIVRPRRSPRATAFLANTSTKLCRMTWQRWRRTALTTFMSIFGIRTGRFLLARIFHLPSRVPVRFLCPLRRPSCRRAALIRALWGGTMAVRRLLPTTNGTL